MYSIYASVSTCVHFFTCTNPNSSNQSQVCSHFSQWSKNNLNDENLGAWETNEEFQYLSKCCKKIIQK